MRRIVPLLLILALAALTVLLFPPRSPDPSPATRGIADVTADRAADRDAVASRDREPAPAAAAPLAAPFAAPAGAAPDAPDPALFDDRVPLPQRIAALDRRARRGDAAAGCQLATELLRCANERAMAGFHAGAEARALRMADGRQNVQQLQGLVDHEFDRERNNREVRARCEGVDLQAWAAPSRYLRAAAERGHAPSMLLYLDESLYRSEQLFRDPGLIAMFRADAPRYFQRLVEGGHANVMWVARNAMQSHRDPLREVLPTPWNQPGFAEAMLARAAAADCHAESASSAAAPDPRVRQAADRLWRERFEPALAEDRAALPTLSDFRLGRGDDFGCASLATP